jgi:hypothetical protein
MVAAMVVFLPIIVPLALVLLVLYGLHLIAHKDSRYRPCSCCLPRILTASASGL